MDGVTKEQVRCFHSICSEYDLHDSEPATVDLIAMLVAFLRPTTVVEAGTYRGRMAMVLANIIHHTGGSGVVYTADPEDRVTATLEIPELAHLGPHLRYWHGDYLEMLADVPGDIDLAYIDASSVENPHLRWEHAMATYLRLRDGGLMLVDDTASADWKDAARFRDIASIYLPEHRGLTIIQKRRPWL